MGAGMPARPPAQGRLVVATAWLFVAPVARRFSERHRLLSLRVETRRPGVATRGGIRRRLDFPPDRNTCSGVSSHSVWEPPPRQLRPLPWLPPVAVLALRRLL